MIMKYFISINMIVKYIKDIKEEYEQSNTEKKSQKCIIICMSRYNRETLTMNNRKIELDNS